MIMIMIKTDVDDDVERTDKSDFPDVQLGTNSGKYTSGIFILN